MKISLTPNSIASRYNFTCNVLVPGFYTMIVEYRMSKFAKIETKQKVFEIQNRITSLVIRKNDFKQAELQDLPLTISKSSPIKLRIE